MSKKVTDETIMPPKGIVYKNYEISEKPNDFGYYEGVNITDCDAQVLTAKSIDEVKIEVDELEL